MGKPKLQELSAASEAVVQLLTRAETSSCYIALTDCVRNLISKKASEFAPRTQSPVPCLGCAEQNGRFHLLPVYSRLNPTRRTTDDLLQHFLDSITTRHLCRRTSLPFFTTTHLHIMEQPTNTTDVKGAKQIVPEGELFCFSQFLSITC